MTPSNSEPLHLCDYAVGDGVTDDTAGIQNFFNCCSATGRKGILDNRTFIISHLTYPSNLHIDGNGAIFLQKPGSGSSMAIGSNWSGGGNSNITFENMTWDGNAENQPHNETSDTQMFQALCVRNFTLRNVTLCGAYGCTLYISGPGVLPALPYGQQYNFNVTIDSCTIDGLRQRAVNVDTCDIETVQKLSVRHSTWRGSTQNLLGLSFNTDFNIEDNEFSGFQFGVNCETSSWGTIKDNGFFGLGSVTPGTPDQLSIAIWLSTYNASAGGTGYTGCSHVKVSGTKIRNLSKTGNAGLIGIFIEGQGVPAGGNNGIIVEGNHLSYFIAPNACYYIAVDGGNTDTVINGNVVEGANAADEVGVFVGGTYLALGGSLADTIVSNNRIKGCGYGIAQNGTGHTGTALTGNNARGCATGYSIANPTQAGYMNSGNV